MEMKIIVQRKNLSSLSQRFSKKFHKKGLDNRGASFVMVLMVMALIFVLVSIILMITVTNVFMKDAGQKNTKNFYDAESSMDEIKAGLAAVCGKANTYAKIKAAGEDASNRTTVYYQKYVEYIEHTLEDTSTSTATVKYYKIDQFTSSAGGAATDSRRAYGYNADSFDSSYDGLFSCLKGTRIGNVKPSDASIGGEVLTSESSGMNYLNIYPSTGEVVLKNVSVKYTDDNDYVTQIDTDIRLQCPNADLNNTSTINNVLYYTLITDDSIDLSGGQGTNQFEGNMFVGYNDSVINKYKVNMKPGATVTSSAGQICYFTSGGNINLYNNAVFDITNSQMWVKGIKLVGEGENKDPLVQGTITNGSTFELNAGADKSQTQLYLQDDLNLGAGARVSLSGELYGFGNPEDLAASNIERDSSGNIIATGTKGSYAIANKEKLPAHSQTMPESDTSTVQVLRDTKYDIKEKPYEYSSAILVNGKNTSLDLSGLSKMSLAGNAYVNANPTPSGRNNKNIRTGESISVKSSQRAYLFPAKNLTFDANPVSASSYSAYQQEVYNDSVSNGSVDSSDHRYYVYRTGDGYAGTRLPVVKDADGTDKFDSVTGKYEVDVSKIRVDITQFIQGTKSDGSTTQTGSAHGWRDFIADGYDESFYDLGVEDVNIAAFRKGSSPVLYFFMVFKSDQKANDFFNKYFNQTMFKMNSLEERVKYFTSGGGDNGLKLPSNLSNTSNFYFNGNLVATNQDSVIVPDTFTSLKSDLATANKKEQEELENSGDLYDKYFGLLTKLDPRYSALTSDDKSHTLYENVIDETQLADAFSVGVRGGVIGYMNTNKRYYVSDTGKGAVICYEADDPTTGRQDITVDDSDLEILKDIYEHNHYGSRNDVSLNLIVTNTNLTIGSDIRDFKGLMIAKGKITIDHDMNITQDPSAVIVAMNAVHIAETANGSTGEGYKVNVPRVIFKNPVLYSMNGMNVDGTPGQENNLSITLPSLVTYENWTRQ